MKSWTPNLEKLAGEGIRFSNAYASSPRCTPSRASLFTGKSPAAPTAKRLVSRRFRKRPKPPSAWSSTDSRNSVSPATRM
ncbi:MAG: sulfatase-like hydrolase/transferase [Armatimonadetes bacterium]|nr:sulfatase-like hydrolase/transferase [Armatimonadota bacterium]